MLWDRPVPGSPQWMAPELLCSLEAGGLKPGPRKLEFGDRKGFNKNMAGKTWQVSMFVTSMMASLPFFHFDVS